MHGQQNIQTLSEPPVSKIYTDQSVTAAKCVIHEAVTQKSRGYCLFLSDIFTDQSLPYQDTAFKFHYIGFCRSYHDPAS